MTGSYPLLIALSLACVPISWLTPRKLAPDAVALWTLACLALFYPAAAVWVLSIALVLPLVLSSPAAPRNAAAAALVVVLIAALVASRFLSGWAWVGGAFFTLRALHVVIEWWMARMPAPSLRDSLRYFLFLPVIVAGPINRMPHFLHQLRRRRWDIADLMTGAERVLFGLFAISVLSGSLCTELRIGVAKLTSAAPQFWADWALSAVDWINLYIVFSGSAHLALGTSLMMGLRLEENFDRPWQARSLIEFWRRWHITLTSWVQDYVFRPLTALTRKPALGLVAAMLVVGLWHAFSLYYVLWSFWQSLGIVLARLLQNRPVPRQITWLGPLWVFAWLAAARPVIGLIGVSP